MPLIPSARPHTTLATATTTISLETIPGKLTSEPTGKQRRNQTQQVVKHRNRLGNDPRYRPQHKSNHHPRPDRQQTALVHPVRTPEEPDVDVLACDVAVDHACYHDLHSLLASQPRPERKGEGD